MKILITGAQGFVGKNLTAELRNRGLTDLLLYDIDTDTSLLDTYCREADFIYHLAGVNRPKDPEEFMRGNFGFTSTLLDTLTRHGNRSPVVLSSSIQAALSNPYGESKRAGEKLLLDYGNRSGSRIFIYRFPNIFGKWCRPNYNSAVATFCHNIASDLPIQINDPQAVMQLVYIDDVVGELIGALQGRETAAPGEPEGYYTVPVVHTIPLGEIARLLRSFRDNRADLSLPDVSDPLVRKLYSTYLSYLPPQKFSRPLLQHSDERGFFAEFIRTPERGQFSVNRSRPGVTKGNHWHHTKNEKFLVVSGEGVIRLRRIDSDEVHPCRVSGRKLEVIDIPPGYTHNIENLGEDDMVALMWASECFDPEHPDTYYLEV